MSPGSAEIPDHRMTGVQGCVSRGPFTISSYSILYKRFGVL